MFDSIIFLFSGENNNKCLMKCIRNTYGYCAVCRRHMNHHARDWVKLSRIKKLKLRFKWLRNKND